MPQAKSKRKTRSDKFPLTLHKTGQFCKKIKGSISIKTLCNLYLDHQGTRAEINVGGSFNVCHWLKVEGDIDYRPILKESLPYLFVVSTCGAESSDTKTMGWDKLVQPLDRGSFDNYTLWKYLKEIGYTGPIGLRGYRIQGDPEENLAASVNTWKAFQERYRREHQ